ncbi:MAG TPA: histidinol-phosphatase [Acidimicrobiales bacterium]|nr:histidinol-phosphatase [Acidimicrobiales bacterium]
MSEEVGDLEVALQLCDIADRITSKAFRRPDLVVETKPDLTPVTEADRQVELAIRDELAQRRPQDLIVGEEFGETCAPDGRTPSASRRWIIDPIDGTKNFVRGIPVWATLVALECDERLTVGAVSAPALGRRWWASRGNGAFAGTPENPSPIRVSAVNDLADAQLSNGSLSGWENHGGPSRVVDLALRCWRDRAFGDFWSHMLVAEGACEIALDPIVSLWDLAAIQVIVEEAGGRFTDLSGVARADGGSAISSNAILHDQVLAILNAEQ